MADTTISGGWREKGNASYRNFTDSNSSERQRNYLESALRSYYRAYETAKNSVEKSSAAKNYAVAAWRLTTVLSQLDEVTVHCEFRFREAISYFSKAIVIGQACQSAEWIDKLDDSFETCVKESIDLAETLSDIRRIEMLENYIQVMCEDSQKPALFLEIATVLSEVGTSALTTKDFLPALQAFHDCYRPIQEIRRLTREAGDIYNEASVIEADVAFHMATASALQAIKNGDDSLESALNDDETLCMDKVYDTLDWYKKAVTDAREIEVEMEAMAVSRLGAVYDKVLKLKSRAKDYFKLCVQLAVSMQPRSFSGESWYKTCMEALQGYQSEAVRNDETEAIRQQEREKYMKELEAELKDLKEANVGSGAGFLRHIYKTYPPKNPEHKLNDKDLDERAKMKKALLTAIHHYHPDKQDKEGDDSRKWAVLCEEITKLLNGRYETHKFPSSETETE